MMACDKILRMRRTKPVPHSISLQPRDIAILRDLFESRAMTSGHVATLHFNNRSEASKKRLQALKNAHLIAVRPRKAFEPAILHITHGGLSILRNHGVLAQYPPLPRSTLERRVRVSDATLTHELAVMDVKTAIITATRETPPFVVSEFTTWPHLIQFDSPLARLHGGSRTVKPDGFFRIAETSLHGRTPVHSFFLELDRSTETQEILVNRATCYSEHYKSGRFASLHGVPPSAYKEHPFRVLYVLKTKERRNNTAEHLLQATPPILSHVWLTTIDDITRDPLGPIWIRPIDYRDAVRNSPFQITDRLRPHVYRRDTLRDQHVETLVHKHCLLGDEGSMPPV